LGHETITEDDINKMEEQIASSVESAIADNVNFWDGVWGVSIFWQ
jgi:hypothetical protein